MFHGFFFIVFTLNFLHHFFSYDVVNLYPSIPLREATVIMLDLLNQDPDYSKYTKLKIPEIKKLLELCLSKCYFLWNNEIHLLKDSGPIGLSIMVVMAEGFLQVLEAKAMNEALHRQPPLMILSFFRYVDDSHSRFQEMDSADRFLEILNKQHPKIKYTIEKETDEKELQFLDIRIMNKGTGKYEFDVFRKNAITNVQVKPQSGHDPRILRGIFKGFLNRALSICSRKYIDNEMEFLVNIFVENGYKRDDLEKMVNEIKNKNNEAQPVEQSSNEESPATHTITLPWIPGVSTKLRKVYRKAGYKVVFKSGKNLGNILTSRNKDKLPKNSYPGVYKIPCSCGITAYRGETKKKISSRTKEHKTDMEKQKWDKSAVAMHSKDCNGRIEFENTETVAVENNRFNRKVREAIEIQKHDCYFNDGGINQDRGQYVSTKFWMPMLYYLKKEERIRGRHIR